MFAGRADIVEVFNAKVEDQAVNVRAADLAARYDLPGGAGSDAHDPEGIGAAYLEMPDFDGPADFLAALRLATITGEYRPHAPAATPARPAAWRARRSVAPPDPAITARQTARSRSFRRVEAEPARGSWLLSLP